MKLGAKLLIPPLLITALAIVAALVYGWVDYREGQQTAAADGSDLQSLKTSLGAQEALSQMRGGVYRTLVVMASLDDGAVNAARASVREQARTIDLSLAGVGASMQGDEQAGKVVGTLASGLAEFARRCDKAIDMSTMDPNVGAGSMRAAEDSYVGLSRDLKALVARIEALRELRLAATAHRQSVLQVVLAVALLVAGTGTAIVTWRLQRRIKAELAHAVDLSVAVANGELGAAGQGGGAAGDDEIGDLNRALVRMVQGLSLSLSTVRAASDRIDRVSQEIASGNSELSQRTEAAATSLQATASSFEQINGSVAQTAESSRSAHVLAANARMVAERGSSVVSEVVTTMQDIQARSRRIGDIVSTIDGIAFQTNILALNAAVEAARAGEQGRGFAVVASEVRSLAQRSASAAREVKGLIGASLESVEAGSLLVADAGRTMSDILGSVQRVSKLIGEISTAAAEQSSGIGRVNGAVSDLDRMTQMNATMVGKSAAAAQSLEEQAHELARVVSGFRLAPVGDTMGHGGA